MAYGKPKITGAMPYKYCADDAQWIDAQLSMLEQNAIRKAYELEGAPRLAVLEQASMIRVETAMAYASAYVQEEQMHDVEYQKTGAARFAANTRLRKFLNKKIAS